MPVRKLTDNLQNIEENRYDICIIGSGPAGLTLCGELIDSGKKIAVIECGGLIRNEINDKLREVKNEGEIKIKNNSRERVFGGTSTTWAGLSAPMDKIDLEKWPIDHEELKKYYRETHRYGFPNIDDFNLGSIDNIRKKSDFTLESENLVEKIFIAKDPPWNFAEKNGYVFNNINIDLYTDSTVIHLSSNKDSAGKTTITNILIKNIDGTEYKIFAENFILCAGGIENVRLLLLSCDTSVTGLGNEYDQVGRYIMNHPKNNHGIVKLNKPLKDLTYLSGYLHSGWAKYAGIRVNENLQKSLGILNSYTRFEPIFPWTDSSGVLNFILIVKKLKSLLIWWKSKQKKIVNLKDWNETGDDSNIENKFKITSSIIFILKDINNVLLYIVHRLFQNKKIYIKKLRLRNFMEMEARSENRIVLSDEMDRNGKKIPQITLNCSDLDKRSLIELHRVLAEEIKNRNIGVLESNLNNINPWPINIDASHHIGGTIMGTDPRLSVVDKDLKVHSVENLYICSSSVFPTSGCANPTYTICALAIRLAQKIKSIAK